MGQRQDKEEMNVSLQMSFLQPMDYYRRKNPSFSHENGNNDSINLSCFCFRNSRKKIMWKDFFETQITQQQNQVEWPKLFPDLLKTLPKHPFYNLIRKQIISIYQKSYCSSILENEECDQNARKTYSVANEYFMNSEIIEDANIFQEIEKKQIISESIYLKFKEDQEQKLFEKQIEQRIYRKLNMCSFQKNTFILPVQQSMQMNYNDEKLSPKQKEVNVNSAIHCYKEITSIILQSLQDDTNPLNTILYKFIASIILKYDLIYNEYINKKMIFDQFKYHNEQLIHEFVSFINTFQETLCYYFSLVYLEEYYKPNYTLFTKDNLITFVTSIVFTQEIYQLIYKFQKTIDQDKKYEEKFQQIYEQIKGNPPDNYKIPSLLCLNYTSYQYCSLLFEEKLSSIANTESLSMGSREKCSSIHEIIEEEIDELNEIMKKTENFFEISSSGKLIFKDISWKHLNKYSQEYEKKKKIIIKDTYDKIQQLIRQEKQNKEKKHSYQGAIELLSQMEHQKNPSHKLKCLVKISEQILVCIQDFYKNINIQFKKKLDGDDILDIFIFIVANSNITDLQTQCNIISNFIPPNMVASIGGYYFCVLQSCIEMILNNEEMKLKYPLLFEDKQESQSFQQY